MQSVRGQGKLGSSDRRDWQAILPQSDRGWGVGLDMVTGWSRGRRIASGTVGVVTTIDGLDG